MVMTAQEERVREKKEVKMVEKEIPVLTAEGSMVELIETVSKCFSDRLFVKCLTG